MDRLFKMPCETLQFNELTPECALREPAVPLGGGAADPRALSARASGPGFSTAWVRQPVAGNCRGLFTLVTAAMIRLCGDSWGPGGISG